MGNRRPSGLIKRGGVWHIDKVFRGTRIRESTSTGDLAKAQELLARRIDQIRTANVYGLRLDRSLRAAATKFLEENQQKRSLADDAMLLRQLDPCIGDLALRQVHMGSLQPFIAGVSFEDRQDLLGHKSMRITTHYSASEFANLIAASEEALEKSPTKVPTTNGCLARATQKTTPKPLKFQELM